MRQGESRHAAQGGRGKRGRNDSPAEPRFDGGAAAMSRRLAAVLAATLSLGWGAALALDTSCAAVRKAGQAALAQPRIHAAIDAPLDPEAVKMGWKKTLMHSIVIGQEQHSNALQASFRKTALATPGDRLLASDLGAFMVEQGCQSAGTGQVAGRDAQIFTATGDMGRGVVRLKYWIDKSTGLPLRMVSDEPAVGDAEVEAALQALGQKKNRPGAPAPTQTGQKTSDAAGPRSVSTHAYVFGELVKPPAKAGVDPAALAALQALLR